MIRERLTQLMVLLTDNTVLGELLTPVQQALASVRGAASLGRVLSMPDFIALGVLRHLRGMATLREQVQMIAAAAMSFSSVSVIGNALRLRSVDM